MRACRRSGRWFDTNGLKTFKMFKSFKTFASEEMRYRINVHEYASVIDLRARRLNI